MSEVPSPWIERLQKLEVRFEAVGDALNPILVKETRQALKSRQFLITFSLLLLASFGWSVAGSMLQMPNIYYTPSAPRLLVGYYFLLAVPMLFVVPLAAYRSLAAEIDDGTLELLRVTTLTPMQIVVGKLCSALLQMMIYFVTLIPCVAYAYALRGTDLPTLGVLLGLVLLAAIQMTVVGLFLAPLSSGRAGQLTALIALVAALLIVELYVGRQALELISQASVLSAWARAFLSFSGVALVACNSYVLLTAASALLAPACSNRSTKIRVALLIQQLAVCGLLGYAVIEVYGSASMAAMQVWFSMTLIEVVPWMGVGYAAYWLLVGSMMAAESPILTPRVRREMPRSFVGRALLTFLMPGSATGVVFAALAAGSALLFVWGGVWYLEPSQLPALVGIGRVSLAAFGYVCVFLVLTRWSAMALRRVTDFRPAVGLALLAILGLATSITPYSIYMLVNDFPSSPTYSNWQIMNWVWTLETVWEDRSRNYLHWGVFAIGNLMLLGHVVFLGPAVLPQHIPTPLRVEQERQRLSGQQRDEALPADPLAAEA
ncbi:ABC transporter permease [Roseimaritima ulvae]|uniref:ABC-2 family transporter protein n=1 Tax=Roseimaritima ulvae TaxID=980254 RepID=A0A5B9QU58_9BACT|nr:ABC transporter permease subunit [Roseimaritima ulvae]QEG41489.1 ABC-2 family transporter protein [Roseimaritima ulvae]